MKEIGGIFGTEHYKYTSRCTEIEEKASAKLL